MVRVVCKPDRVLRRRWVVDVGGYALRKRWCLCTGWRALLSRRIVSFVKTLFSDFISQSLPSLRAHDM